MPKKNNDKIKNKTTTDDIFKPISIITTLSKMNPIHSEIKIYRNIYLTSEKCTL